MFNDITFVRTCMHFLPLHSMQLQYTYFPFPVILSAAASIVNGEWPAKCAAANAWLYDTTTFFILIKNKAKLIPHYQVCNKIAGNWAGAVTESHLAWPDTGDKEEKLEELLVCSNS